MPILPWRTDADGYFFNNTWTFDAAERAALNALVTPAISGVIPLVAAINPLIPLDPGLMATLTVAAAAYTALGPLPGFGMCGGMAWSSLDHWLAKVPLPAGASATGQPTSTGGLVQAQVRAMIWKRLLDSLNAGGALSRTLEWSLVLNQVPSPLGGGSQALVTRTAAEWTKLKARINAGVPCPIALVYGNRDVWNQHQILAYGYDDLGHGGRLYVYDSNFPHVFGETGHNVATEDIVTFDLSGSTLNAKSPSDFGDHLAGFFCTGYHQVTPPTGLAPSFGTFVTFMNDPRTWMDAHGAGLPIASNAELTALGGTTAGVVAVSQVAPTGTPKPSPRDGALLREHSATRVLLYQGGGPFLVPDATQLAHFGGSGAVRAVPDGSLQAFMGPPMDGTLLREFSSSQVFRIVNGLPTVTTLPSDVDVRVVPDGAIAGSLLDRITFSVPRLTIGRSATATVWLKAPFTGDLVANLSFTPAGFASIPATVTIPKHTLSASFTISTPSVVLPASPMSIAVAATIGGVMASASLPLQIPRLVRFDVAPSIITAGAKGATGTIALEVPYAADLVVSLHSYSPTFATVPPTVTIPKGQTSASFNIVAPASQAAFALFTVSLQAAVADTSVNATIQVRSSVVQGTLKTISLSASSIQAGGSVTLTATLDAVVPTATDVILAAQTPGGMTTSPYIASINPSTIHVAAGQTQGTATIVTKSSASGHSVHIMATAVSIKYATLTIT